MSDVSLKRHNKFLFLLSLSAQMNGGVKYSVIIKLCDTIGEHNLHLDAIWPCVHSSV